MRAEIELTFTIGYDINPDNYPRSMTNNEDRLKVDMELAAEDPISFLLDHEVADETQIRARLMQEQ